MTTPLQEAVAVAARVHGDEDREGETPLPYLSHVMDVLQNLRYVGGVTDQDLLVAAALHDTVESGGIKLSEIQSKFGSRVGGLVGELTRREPGQTETAGMTRDEIWTLRSSILLAEIQGMSDDAQKVKLADRLSNVQEGKRSKTKKKLDRYLAQSRKILEIIPRKRNPGLWDAIKAEL
jgi:(p)ppGpp synthase/HD superfamily hydrolase